MNLESACRAKGSNTKTDESKFARLEYQHHCRCGGTTRVGQTGDEVPCRGPSIPDGQGGATTKQSLCQECVLLAKEQRTLAGLGESWPIPLPL
jgi:hypothetical protein